MLADLTMKDFMKELASNSPIPGGGSIAAMCGSTGCNLVAMVAALTVGKKGYEEYWDEMAKLKADMEAISDEQLKAIDDDANAYATVVGCFSMPKNTEEEKALRAKTIQEKTEEAAQVPLGIAERAVPIFNGAREVIAKGNKNAVSDGAIAAMMARTAILGALYNVRINAVSLKDEAKKAALLKRCEELEKLAQEEEADILKTVVFK